MAKTKKGKKSRYTASNDEQGIRPAAGNKFKTILDSYVYGVARLADVTEDEYCDASNWCAALFGGREFLDLLFNVADEEKTELRLTVEELIQVDIAELIILREDGWGYVEVDFYESEDKGWADWCTMLAEEFGVDADLDEDDAEWESEQFEAAGAMTK